MKLEDLKVGQKIYSVKRNTTVSRGKYKTYCYVVHSVNLKERSAMLRSGLDKPEWCSEKFIENLRASTPKQRTKKEVK